MEVIPLASKRDWVSGIDALEVTALMYAIESLHGVRVNLLVSLDGGFKPYRMQLTAIAERTTASPTGLKRSVSRKRFYPSVDAASLEGLMYRLLHELDHDCGEMWRQEVIPI